MTDLWLRKWDCGVCNDLVIVDVEAGTVTCNCRTSFVPQWLLIDAWQKKKWLKDYRPTSQAEIDRLRMQRQNQTGAAP